MTDRDALLAAIIAHPAEDTPRAAFCDLLRERQEWTEDHLLRLVCEHPAADGLRLLYADWCEGQTVPCGRCVPGANPIYPAPGKLRWHAGDGTTGIVNCPACNGTGRNTSYRDRAEFIRVQIELARPFGPACAACGRPLGDDRVADGCPCNSPRGVNHGRVPAYACTCAGCDPHQTGSVRERPAVVDALRRRERELWSGFGTPYERSRVFGLPANWLAFLPDETEGISVGYMPSDGDAVVRRGFVEAALMPADVFVGGPCGGCKGTGGTEWPGHPLPAGGFSRQCRSCSGSGRTPGLAAALFRAHPLSRVVLTDREPLEWTEDPGASSFDGRRWFSWLSPRRQPGGSPYRVPGELFDVLLGLPGAIPNYRDLLSAVRYDTRDAALSALSAACVRYGRRLAGLPPL